MEDKEKQIEEMAKDCYYVAHLLRFNDPYMLSPKGWSELTKEMIKLGWIKPTKDSVVVSKEEYECLKSIEKSYDPFWFCAFGGCEGVCKECKDTCEMSIFVKKRKETAEKYHKAMRKVIHERDYIKGYAEIGLQEENDEIAKQFGVEIKE